jgi:hypothetical protein
LHTTLILPASASLSCIYKGGSPQSQCHPHYDQLLPKEDDLPGLNLERLGASLDGDLQAANTTEIPRAITEARLTFRVIASRHRSLRERANNLSTVANDVAPLWAAFRAIEDSSRRLSLSTLATVIFRFTLMASILSMGGRYGPNESHFWVFFRYSIPFLP